MLAADNTLDIRKRSMKKIVAGIVAHVDAGKTTLSEMMLYKSGAIRSLGRVDSKDSHMDTDEIEKQRGITIYSSQSRIVLEDTIITFLDTPGHVDFSAEMERTLSVLDYAILVISGIDGVQSHTRTLFRLLESYGVPTFVFVNKMDISYKTREELIENIKNSLANEACSVNSDDFYENIAMSDESLLDVFMESGHLAEAEVAKAIADRKVFPIYFGSALKDEGVDELLADLDRYTIVRNTLNEKLSARAYKITRDKNKVRETHIKIISGSIRPKELLQPFDGYPSDARKINEIRVYDGEKYTSLDCASAGDICVVTGLDESYPGQGFGECEDARLPELVPVLSYIVELKKDQNVSVVYSYFKELMDEDPMLNVSFNERLALIKVELMGQIQLEVLKQKLLSRYKIDVSFGVGKIVYRETIKESVTGHGHYEPLKHFADVILEINPLPAGSGIRVNTRTSTDVLPMNYQHQVLNYLSRREHPGVLSGFPVTDLEINLIAGKSHKKHTEGGDFRRATDIALRDGLLRAENVLLEPYYNVCLELPQSYVGRAMNDIEAMHGSLKTPEITGDKCILKGRVPVASVMNYASEVAAYTSGQGNLMLTMAGYYPCHNAKEVIEEIGYNYLNDLKHPYESIYVHQENPIELPLKVQIDLGLVDENGNSILNNGFSGAGKYENSKEGSAKNATRVGSSNKGDYKGYGGLEPELEQIFVREFGQITRYRDSDHARVIDSRQENITKAREDYLKAHPSIVDKQENKKNEQRVKYLLVDGYNLIYAWPELKAIAEDNLEGARGALLDKLCNYAGYTGYETIVVFDAYKVKGNIGEAFDYQNIHVVYTKEAQSADSYIQRATHEMRNKDKSDVTVVSSDGLVQLIVLGEGALRVSSREFVEMYEK